MKTKKLVDSPNIIWLWNIFFLVMYWKFKKIHIYILNLTVLRLLVTSEVAHSVAWHFNIGNRVKKGIKIYECNFHSALFEIIDACIVLSDVRMSWECENLIEYANKCPYDLKRYQQYRMKICCAWQHGQKYFSDTKSKCLGTTRILVRDQFLHSSYNPS